MLTVNAAASSDAGSVLTRVCHILRALGKPRLRTKGLKDPVHVENNILEEYRAADTRWWTQLQQRCEGEVNRLSSAPPVPVRK